MLVKGGTGPDLTTATHLQEIAAIDSMYCVITRFKLSTLRKHNIYGKYFPNEFYSIPITISVFFL